MNVLINGILKESIISFLDMNGGSSHKVGIKVDFFF